MVARKKNVLVYAAQILQKPVVIAAMLLYFASDTYAQNVTRVDGVSYTTQGLSDYTTLGSMMYGMTVTANFIDGSYQTLSWGEWLGYSDGGGVAGNGWSLFQIGNTWDQSWTLTTDRDVCLDSLVLNGASGDTIFDTKDELYNIFDTPGSARGWPFEVTSGQVAVDAIYSNIVSLQGRAYGDLYETLTLNFGDDGFSGSFRFRAETDTSAAIGDVIPVNPAVVPEPGSLLLLGSGIFGMGVLLLRRK